MIAQRGHILLLILIIPLISCDKKDDEGCLGCGMDYSIHEYTFQIEGNLVKNCTGDVAANKTLELFLYYHQGIDSLVSSGIADANGHFSITYKKKLPGVYQFTSQWESYCLLKVPEDSVTYFLSGVKNINNLQLQLNDSLNLNVILDYLDTPLKESDTLRYGFEPFIMKFKPYPYYFKGPAANHTLINNIKDKRRFIQIDENGNPISQLYWIIRNNHSWIENSNWYRSSSKVPCLMRQDSVIINLN